PPAPRFDAQTGQPIERPAPPTVPAPPPPTPDPLDRVVRNLNLYAGNPAPSTPVAPVAPAPRPSPAAPRPPMLNLDAAQFTPPAGDALRQAAIGLGANRFATAFTFGLQSQIPPADDPRTAVIDAALIGQGLLTPQELTDIHA